MTKKILVLVLASISLAACGGGSSGGGGGGGGSGSGSGTCESTCKKSIALNCMNGEHDQAACVASCEQQKSACSAIATEHQAFLDCIESTKMECGSTSGAPSSPECLDEGLVVLACSLGGS